MGGRAGFPHQGHLVRQAPATLPKHEHQRTTQYRCGACHCPVYSRRSMLATVPSLRSRTSHSLFARLRLSEQPSNSKPKSSLIHHHHEPPNLPPAQTFPSYILQNGKPAFAADHLTSPHPHLMLNSCSDAGVPGRWAIAESPSVYAKAS